MSTSTSLPEGLPAVKRLLFCVHVCLSNIMSCHVDAPQYMVMMMMIMIMVTS